MVDLANQCLPSFTFSYHVKLYSIQKPEAENYLFLSVFQENEGLKKDIEQLKADAVAVYKLPEIESKNSL